MLVPLHEAQFQKIEPQFAKRGVQRKVAHNQLAVITLIENIKFKRVILFID